MRYFSCWDILNELKVDKSKVFVIFSKSDGIPSERIDHIVSDLRIADPIVISSKTGYGIHKLKRMMASHLIKSAMTIPNIPKIGLTDSPIAEAVPTR
jgi:GTP-binding protein HflX